MDWKKILTPLEARIDQMTLPRRIARARGAKLEIVPYLGFGTARVLTLSGRLLAEKRIVRATDRESVWQNLLESVQRFRSVEIPGARLAGSFAGHRVEVLTDEEGYFHLRLDLTEPVPDGELWHQVAIELLDPAPRSGLRVTGEVLVPPTQAKFAVISDLDDTVIQTGATNLIRMLKTTLLQSARSRLPFEGVADFYSALHAGGNPIFYVSSSPWNLYELLAEFLRLHQIPAGPLLLGDFGFDETKWIHAPHDDHKNHQIRRIFDTYPDLPFVLIGDSGQRDPEIYLEVVRSDPSRVRAVYIRDVTTPQRDAEVHAIAEKIAEAGVEMLLVADSAQAAEHARSRALIV